MCSVLTIVYISGFQIYISRKICIVRHLIFRKKLIVHPSQFRLFITTCLLMSRICALFCAVWRFCAPDMFLCAFRSYVRPGASCDFIVFASKTDVIRSFNRGGCRNYRGRTGEYLEKNRGRGKNFEICASPLIFRFREISKILNISRCECVRGLLDCKTGY